MTPDADTLVALGRIEDAQAELRERLRAIALSQLIERPPSGAWSPMENVRHLVFAEQHHFGPHLPRGFRWSSAGVPPPNRTGERRLSPVGSDPATSIDEVFDAWAAVHAVVRALCIEAQGALTRKLDGNLK
ncbi:MAG TPA: DinB family protein, partial [Dehalococcoidia bacterium]|nr:DinB family protein [Dehalococcoidia bacterium]